MRKLVFIVLAAALVFVALFGFLAVAHAGPAIGFATDPNSMSGDGTASSPVGLRRTCSANQVLKWSGTAWGCADNGSTYTAGSGLTLTTTTFSIDPTYTQRRVSGTCGAGSSIRVIAQDGSVTCETDDSGITMSAGVNVVPKSDGANLVASTMTDDTTAVSFSKNIIGSATTKIQIGGPSISVTDHWIQGPISPTTRVQFYVHSWDATGVPHTTDEGLGIASVNQLTYDTTLQASSARGIEASVTATRVLGLNTLQNIAVVANASGGDENYSFASSNGIMSQNDDVHFGSNIIGDTDTRLRLGQSPGATYDNWITGPMATAATIYHAVQATGGGDHTADASTFQATNTLTYNTAASDWRAIAVNASATGTRTSGANRVMNVAVNANASGGQVNIAYQSSQGLMIQAGDAFFSGTSYFGGASDTTLAHDATIGGALTVTTTGSFGGIVNMNSHKITNLTNGSSAQDAAAFGQIGSAVNAAVSGTANKVAKFTGTNAIGNGWASDDGTTWGVASLFTITEASGNFHGYGTGTIDGAVAVAGNFAVNTSKFTVDATTGDANVLGTLSVTTTTQTKHIKGAGVTTVSSCGSGASVGSESNNLVGSFTVGTSASGSCTLNFNGTWGVKPRCHIETAAGAVVGQTAQTPSATDDVISTLSDATSYYYWCTGGS